MAARVGEKHKPKKGKGTQRWIDKRVNAREQVAHQEVGAAQAIRCRHAGDFVARVKSALHHLEEDGVWGRSMSFSTAIISFALSAACRPMPFLSASVAAFWWPYDWYNLWNAFYQHKLNCVNESQEQVIGFNVQFRLPSDSGYMHYYL